MIGHRGQRALVARLAWVAATAVCGPAPAQAAAAADLDGEALPELGPEAALGDYLQYASLANQGLEAARKRWEAAISEAAQARSLPEPQLSYSRTVRPMDSSDGPREQKLGLSQGFPWFGTLRLRGEAAEAAAAAARQEYEQARLELVYRVKAEYARYYYLGRALDVGREHLDLVAHLEGVARARFRSGVATHGAVVQAQLELGRLEDQVRSLEAERVPAMARLNAALHREPGAPLAWPRALAAPEITFTDAEALTWLAEGNADLERLEHLARQRQLGVDLAHKAFYPGVMLGFEYKAADIGMTAGSTGNGTDPIMAMVTVSLPIWRGKYRAAERQARLQGAAVQAERAEAHDRLEAALSETLYRLRDGERKIRLYRDTLLPKAEEAVEVTRMGFESGQGDFISLIDAERLLLELRLAREQAVADRVTALAGIEMLVNRTLWTPGEAAGPQPRAEGAVQ